MSWGAVFALAVVACQCSASTAPADASGAAGAGPGPIVWAVDGMTRVARDEAPGASRVAALSAARGEFEPFQVVIRAPHGGLTNVDVHVSDLVGPEGKLIPASRLQLYLERYVYLPRNSTAPRTGYRPLPPGWFADGLVPFVRADGSPNRDRVPFGVEAGNNQPIWIDVFVPRSRAESAPGMYRGSVEISSAQGNATVDVALRVRDFELPETPSLKSAFGLDPARMDDPREQALLVDHKLMPQYLTAAQIRALGPAVRTTALPFFSHSGSVMDATVGTSRTMDPPPSVEEIRRKAGEFPPSVELYAYVADEPDRYWAIYPTIRAWARAFHAAGVRTLVTVPPQPLLLSENENGGGRSAVDTWVLLPVQFSTGDPSYQRARANGDEIWSYNTLMQDDWSPKWQIDFLPIGYRIQPGFISASLGLTGILYWKADRWTGDYWADPFYYEGKNRFAGDGTLIYPPRTASYDTGVGTQTSGVPSMRLKWLREGVEDYEYVKLLERAGRGAVALEIARSVGQDWRNWTRDPAKLLAARERLADELERALGEGAGKVTAGAGSNGAAPPRSPSPAPPSR